MRDADADVEVERRGDLNRRNPWALAVAGVVLAVCAIAVVIAFTRPGAGSRDAAPAGSGSSDSPIDTTPRSSPERRPPGTPAGENAHHPSTEIPIDEGLPDLVGDGSGIEGPGRHAPGVAEASPCDRAVWPTRGEQRLAVRSTGPGSAESRELVVFPDAERAVAALADVRSALSACPTEVNEDDPTASQQQAWEVHSAETGYQDSVTFSVFYTDGLPGGTIWQLTRVGRAVVAVDLGGEYGPDSVPFAVDRLSDVTAVMTPAMCRFTLDGC